MALGMISGKRGWVLCFDEIVFAFAVGSCLFSEICGDTEAVLQSAFLFFTPKM